MSTPPQLSTLATFDDIRRCMQSLTDGTAEEEFLRVMQLQEQFHLECTATKQEVQRIQRELDTSLQSMADLETKLFHARRLLEVETRARKAAEHERDTLERKIMAVADLLQNENNLRNETKDKLAFLHALPRRRKSMSREIEDTFGGGNEINSTGSFLSNLSITHSEDDFLDEVPVNAMRRKRSSIRPNNNLVHSIKKKRLSGESKAMNVSIGAGRRSNRRQSRLLNTEQHQEQLNISESIGECVRATTTVTIPQDCNSDIRAESIIETRPISSHTGEAAISDKNQCNKNNDNFVFMPTRVIQEPQQQSIVKEMRSHEFASKTFIRAEACCVCEKKIRFGCVGFRCRNCTIRCHAECSSYVSVSCTPQSGTPQSKGVMGNIADYAPAASPKIPPIILHCVNEIENRGLKEVGIYRVSGSEREIKSLKETFIRSKNNSPQLAHIDIHALCGCVKDFLRTLQEPLIPTLLWKEFSSAVQSVSETDIRKYLVQAIDNLPQTNRDTLAFLILHFQRIAECPNVLMPLENIARVFGPTIVGYSSSDPDQHTILTEVRIQYNVMLNLLKMPTEYWLKFIQMGSNNDKGDSNNNDNNNNTEGSGSGAGSSGSQQQHLTGLTKDKGMLYATPSKSTSKKCKMFYGTSPYSKK